MTGGLDIILVLTILLAGIALLSFALLRGWEDWLRLRRLELSEGSRRRPSPAHQRLELLDNILNPSANIAFGYEPWIVKAKGGDVYSGFILAESSK